MTYREFAAAISNFTPEQLDQDVTVFVSGEGELYTVVRDFPLVFTDPEIDDSLDPNHPYLVI